MKTNLIISVFIGLLLFPIMSCKKDKVLKIGDKYQGGIIFYLDGTNEHGMICAENDQSTSIHWYNGTMHDKTNASGTGIGTGNSNTEAIVTQYGVGTYAAKLCYDLTLNDYSDWYLPSKDELNLMFKNLCVKGFGNFESNSYWCSSEYSTTGFYGPWYQSFNTAASNQSYTYYPEGCCHVRAVRSF